MATPRKLWSISALSAEFGLDRRTVASKMASVPPDGRLRRNRAWFLGTAARALLAGSVNGADPIDAIAERAGGPFSTGRNLVDEAICKSW
jgi:hypothetical protein